MKDVLIVCACVVALWYLVGGMIDVLRGRKW